MNVLSLYDMLMDRQSRPAPIPLLLWCPLCHARHLDEGEFATKPHRDHSCQNCGLTWRPALVPTVGVAFLPGYKNEPTKSPDFTWGIWCEPQACWYDGGSGSIWRGTEAAARARLETWGEIPPGYTYTALPLSEKWGVWMRIDHQGDGLWLKVDGSVNTRWAGTKAEALAEIQRRKPIVSVSEPRQLSEAT
jgi:hypothetical protein